MIDRKKRESSFELLRIMAMLIIVAHHYAEVQESGILAFYNDGLSFGTSKDWWVTSFLMPGGTVGVAIFFMITGYFSIYKKGVSVAKVFLETTFYSLIFAILSVFALLFFHDADWMNAIYVGEQLPKQLLLPVTGGAYWFVTVYVFLIILSDYINKILLILNQKGQKFLIFIYWIFWFSLAILLGSYFDSLQNAIFFYIVGAYIRICKLRANKAVMVILFITSWCGSVCNSYVNLVSQIGFKDLILVKYHAILSGINHAFFIPIAAISAFMLAKNLQIGSVNIVNKVAATTFGVYLLHNSPVSNLAIWKGLIDIQHTQYGKALYPLYALITPICVFGVCALIDAMRIRFVEPIVLANYLKIKKRAFKLFTIASED
ncbi:acyltransferase family protein [Butyrivibrio sp. INlla14]|uniref:acyltransferase family protein n=1 Tax=Butyrivibrio sp. INlla14 TaxID=1520808 RepID=UPI0008768D63|nr:acyltransferase family protein [Butyrivibrio sp. INlla14]SCY70172.1 Surface polysaccharide O-acyltransferase, integral membrane enzyme [Butyrivibrio sp. INlla14]